MRMRWMRLVCLGALVVTAGMDGQSGVAKPKPAPAPSTGPRLSASSSARVDGKLQGPELAFDGDLATGWRTAEGSNGEWLELELNPPRLIQTVHLFGGQFSGPSAFLEHNRLAGAELLVTHKGGVHRIPVSLPDAFAPARVEVGLEVKKLRIVLGPAYSGSIYADTTVAEVAFNLEEKDAGLHSALDAWKRSRPGESQLGAHRARLDEAVNAAQAGDLTGFPLIADAARRGLEPLRVQAQKLAGPGFTLSLLDPEPTALDALKKVGTPEAADALDQARYLLDPTDASTLTRAAAYIRAGTELKQAPRRNLPRWGTSGWEAGALRARNEPLALLLDPDEYVFIADIGNNRIQRFDPDGRFERSSGSAASLEDHFFGQEIPYYAAGHRSGDKPGQLSQPLSLAWKKEWGKESLVVLDATFRVQVFDREFRLQGGVQLPQTELPVAGTGLGLPQLLWLDGKPAVAFKKSLILYDAKGKVRKALEFEQPIRTIAVAGKTLWIHHGGPSIMPYTLKGQRAGTPLELPAETSFEDLDLTTDAKGNLYALSDHGMLYVIDSKGRVSPPRKLLEEPLPPMRLAVGKERLFVTGGDRIYVFPLKEGARPARSSGEDAEDPSEASGGE